MIEKLQAHYGFSRMPFGRDLAPGMLHRHASHNEAVARITWTVTERAIGDQWLVRSGLQAGDKLVVDGQQRAAPGVEVKTMQWNPRSRPGTETAKAAPAEPVSAAN